MYGTRPFVTKECKATCFCLTNLEIASFFQQKLFLLFTFSENMHIVYSVLSERHLVVA